VLLDSLGDDEDDMPRHIGIAGVRPQGAQAAALPLPVAAAIGAALGGSDGSARAHPKQTCDRHIVLYSFSILEHLSTIPSSDFMKTN